MRLVQITDYTFSIPTFQRIYDPFLRLMGETEGCPTSNRQIPSTGQCLFVVQLGKDARLLP